jgi:hypothetical protein
LTLKTKNEALKTGDKALPPTKVEIHRASNSSPSYKSLPRCLDGTLAGQRRPLPGRVGEGRFTKASRGVEDSKPQDP